MPLTFMRMGAPRVARLIVDDDYIPLSVHWVPPGSVGVVYYRAQDPNVGDIEVKIEPLTGEVVGLVVVVTPNRNTQIPDSTNIESRVTQGSIFVDLSRWNLSPDLVPRKDAVYEECSLAVGEDERRIYYALSEGVPDRYAMTGQVGLGIDSTDSVVGVLVDKLVPGRHA